MYILFRFVIVLTHTEEKMSVAKRIVTPQTLYFDVKHKVVQSQRWLQNSETTLFRETIVTLKGIICILSGRS
jgi:hypothetical protein